MYPYHRERLFTFHSDVSTVCNKDIMYIFISSFLHRLKKSNISNNYFNTATYIFQNVSVGYIIGLLNEHTIILCVQ